MLKTIHAGRGVAALAVAAFHLSLYMGMAKYGGIPVFESITRFGNLGVDFFFVLSGFIILHAHAKDIDKPGRLGYYAARRFVRLYPIYWLYTLAFLAVMLAGATYERMPQDWTSWVSAIALVRLDAANPPLEIAWTLFHEVAFYAVFATLIANRRVGAALFTAWMVVCLGLYHYTTLTTRTPLGSYTAAYNLNFALGMAAYGIYRRGRIPFASLVVGALLAVSAITAAYAGWPHYRIAFAVAVALVIGSLAYLEDRCALRVPAVLVLLGDASYTIYLLHTLVQPVVLRIVLKLPVVQAVGPQVVYLASLVAATAACVLAYKAIEAPLLQWLRAWLAKAPPATAHVGLPTHLG